MVISCLDAEIDRLLVNAADAKSYFFTLFDHTKLCCCNFSLCKSFASSNFVSISGLMGGLGGRKWHLGEEVSVVRQFLR